MASVGGGNTAPEGRRVELGFGRAPVMLRMLPELLEDAWCVVC